MVDYNKIKLNRVARKYKLRFVILHGSQTTGRSHAGSDIDVAVFEEKSLSFKQQLALHSELYDVFQTRRGQDLDVKTLHKTDPLFRFEVVRDGILLYGNRTDYESFKSSVYLAHEDAKPLRELERHLIDKYQRHLNAVTAAYAQS